MADIYAFGSVVSGEFDDGSDTDILAIKSPFDDNRYPSGWSVYSRDRIKELYCKGTLFAWHIHLEAVPVFSSSGRGFLESIGPPEAYTEAKHEIQVLWSMAEVALNELALDTPSSIYELGVLGVAIRDIGMAASKTFNGNFCFSKNAPYALKGLELPMDRDDYFYLINCRRATTRGHQVNYDDERRRKIMDQSPDILNWCDKVLAHIGKCKP